MRTVLPDPEKTGEQLGSWVLSYFGLRRKWCLLVSENNFLCGVAGGAPTRVHPTAPQTMGCK